MRSNCLSADHSREVLGKEAMLHGLAVIVVSLALLSIAPRLVQAAAGDLDPTFGNGGVVQTTFGDSAAEGNDVVLQADGKIIVVGFTGAGSYSSFNNFALVRFNSDGSLDQSFGVGGKVKSARGVATSAALQADGKILVGGTYDTGSSNGC